MTMHAFFPILLPKPRQRGAGLVTAIFLLVVLAGLATALVSIFGAQSQSAALDERGARVYQAARSGIEWGLFQRSTNGAAYCSAPGAGGARAAANSFALPADSVMAGFSVRVECWMTSGADFNATSANLDRWLIRATACSSALPASGDACPAPLNNPDYVERVIEVQL